MRATDLTTLTDPASIAVVGASGSGSSRFGGRTFRNLAVNGATRTLYPVNPSKAGQKLLGHHVYGSVLDTPEVPDLTVILSPSETVLQALRDVHTRGGRHVLLCTAFRGDDHGLAAAYEADVARLVRELGLVLIGGNSAGVLNGNTGLNATFSTATEDGVPPGGLAFLSQSGGAISYLLATLHGRRVGYSHLISTGNENSVSLPDLLEIVVEDDDTEALVLFLEGVADGRRLRRCFARAGELGKPVAVLKVGTSDAGRVAAQSHTGRMTGDDDVFEAVVAESGVQRVSGYQDLYDLAYRFARVAPRIGGSRARRAAVVTPSGGAATLAADLLRGQGWELPAPSADTSRRLAAAGAYVASNPLDATGSFQVPDRAARLTTAFGESGEYDEIFLLYGVGGAAAEQVALEVAKVVADVPVPVSVGWLAAPPGVAVILEDAGLPVFPDHRRAITAATAHGNAAGDAAHRMDMRLLREMLEAPVPDVEPTVRAGSTLTGADLFAELEHHGVRCAPWAAVPAHDAKASLTDLARTLGYPVALKIDSKALLHKSDVGAVQLGIGSDHELERAARELADSLPAADPSARYLVQRMVPGVEVMIGVRHDESFGHLVVLGPGGTLAELVDDLRSVLLPATARQQRALVESHVRVRTLLSGYRGAAAADLDALVALVSALSRWLSAAGARVAELDLNPVMVSAAGAFVVDARAVLRPPTADTREAQ